LLGALEVWAGSAVRLDDSLREQVADGLAVLGHVGREQVIKRAVFADEDDNVFDGAVGTRFIMIVLLRLERDDERCSQAELEYGYADKSYAKSLNTF
jgi:hypothetical protein